MRRSAFIFDMDGTIVDNMAFHAQSWKEFFSRRGIAIDDDEFFRATAGRVSRDIMRTYLDVSLSDEACRELNAEKEAIYRDLYAPHRKLAAGFADFIDAASAAGVRLAVATAAPASGIDFILGGLGIRERFDAVVGGQDVSHGKPDPEIFLLAAQRCGVAPEDCVVFEDAPLGVEAAARAGMPAVVLTTTVGRGDFGDFNNVIAMGEDFNCFNLRELIAH